MRILRPSFMMIVVLSLSIVALSFMSHDVGAASRFDKTINPTTSLKIGGGGVYPVEDVSVSYMAKIQETYGKYGSSCDNGAFDDFTSTMNSGGQWIITNSDEQRNGENQVNIYWFAAGTDLTEFGWDASPNNDTPNVTTVILYAKPRGYMSLYMEDYQSRGLSCNGQGNMNPNDIGYPTIAGYVHWADYYIVRPFLVTFPVLNLPDGYEGELPSDTGANAFSIDYLIDVNIRDVKFTPRPLSDGVCYKWAASLVQRQGNDSDQIKDWAEVDVSMERYLNSGESYVFKADKYGDDYTLGYDIIDCGDGAFDEKYGEQDHPTGRIDLNIDGSIFTLDSKDLECQGTVCAVPSPYEVCSWTGIGDFGTYTMCTIRNSFIMATSWIKSLFIPTVGAIQDVMKRFNDFFSEKLGFIAQSVSSVVRLVQVLIDGAGNPSPRLEPEGTLFGKSISFDISQAKTVVGDTAYDMLFMIIRAVTAVAILFGFYRTYINFISEGKE